jgi:hypothetical protein
VGAPKNITRLLSGLFTKESARSLNKVSEQLDRNNVNIKNIFFINY